jgi:hypothetical protein
MIWRVSQSEYKPKICTRVDRLGFHCQPIRYEQSSSRIKPKDVILCTFLTDPIVAGAISGRPQSINLAEGGQAAWRFSLASATAIDHRLASIEGDELASLPCQLTFRRTLSL